VCLEIEARYQVKFLEIGTDKDHVHFQVQSVPACNVTKLVTIIKSLTARDVFKRRPEVRKRLWGGEFWTDGYFASTVGRHGNEKVAQALAGGVVGGGEHRTHGRRITPAFGKCNDFEPMAGIKAVVLSSFGTGLDAVPVLGEGRRAKAEGGGL
jgi:hypothetical protein